MANLNSIIHLRVPQQLKSDFEDKASKYGAIADVHRELIQAFTDGRMTIDPNENQPMKELYNEHRK